MTKPSKEQLESIAKEIYEEGFIRCEAYPVSRWKKRKWPETREIFGIIDAFLNLFKRLDDYGY